MNLRVLRSQRGWLNTWLFIVAAFVAAVSLGHAAEELKPIFDGKTLKGWVQRGGKAEYKVEDGSIVGTSVANTPNSFLCTEKEYGDFILELELNADPGLNSGVQIRSHCYDGPAQFFWNGKTNTIAAGRVHGYQVEVDQSDKRCWSGGIYEEGRRGWLFPLATNSPGGRAYKIGDWNQYRIACIGGSIKTWVNGEPAADLFDTETLKGFIALQVHGTKRVGLKVCFRNIRLQDLGEHVWKPREDRVQLTTLDDRVRVEIAGQLFTEYRFKDVPRPFCYPLIGPGGLAMMRHWPMKETENEERDHPHHRSLWFAHGAVNGHDFWSEQKGFGKIVHDGFLEVKSGDESGVIRSRNKWVAADGTLVCTDERTLRFYARPDTERLFDFEVTLKAGDKHLVLGDTKEGTMAVRLAETMRLKPNEFFAGKPTGHIVNSEGVRDGETWGKRAAWCDYYGPVEGKIVGLAIFDHPENPRHPTWWHVRDYGLFAANPFGQHDFESLPDKAAGNLTVPAGKSVTFRYRLYLHEGDEKQGKVAERYQEYVKTSSAESK